MVDTYVPVLRNGRNETPVIRQFNRSSFSGSGSRELRMTPLVEVTDDEDLADLGPFAEAGEYLMTELPQYLTDRSNKYQDDVAELIDVHGGVEGFYLDNADRIEIPVVSGPLDPVDYSHYEPAYRTLSSEFDQVALRLLLTDFGNELTGDQKQVLERLSETVTDDDIVLFDLVDVGTSEELRSDLQYLANLFAGTQRAVLNAFNAYDDQPDNQSPHLADEVGVSGFGDFGINQRFKPDGSGGPSTVKHRHYHPGESTVAFFPADNYEEAQEALQSWSEWERSHCDGCRRASRTSNYDVNTWSQIKMTHYVSSVLNGEI